MSFMTPNPIEVTQPPAWLAGIRIDTDGDPGYPHPVRHTHNAPGPFFVDEEDAEDYAMGYRLETSRGAMVLRSVCMCDCGERSWVVVQL